MILFIQPLQNFQRPVHISRSRQGQLDEVIVGLVRQVWPPAVIDYDPTAALRQSRQYLKTLCRRSCVAPHRAIQQNAIFKPQRVAEQRLISSRNARRNTLREAPREAPPAERKPATKTFVSTTKGIMMLSYMPSSCIARRSGTGDRGLMFDFSLCEDSLPPWQD